MRVEHAEVDFSPKVSVSLRLPRDIVREVEAYAREQGMCKTDAYTHFLERGLLRGTANQDERLDRIEAGIGQILARMGSGEGR